MCLQIKQVFTSIGVSISDDVFQALWREAVSRDAEGKVCTSCVYTVTKTCVPNNLLWGNCTGRMWYTFEMIHPTFLYPPSL